MESNLVAYAAFELNGKQYRRGDIVAIPPNYSLAPAEAWEGEEFVIQGMRFQYSTPGEPDELGRPTSPVIRKIILPIEAE